MRRGQSGGRQPWANVWSFSLFHVRFSWNLVHTFSLIVSRNFAKTKLGRDAEPHWKTFFIVLNCKFANTSWWLRGVTFWRNIDAKGGVENLRNMRHLSFSLFYIRLIWEKNRMEIRFERRKCGTVKRLRALCDLLAYWLGPLVKRNAKAFSLSAIVDVRFRRLRRRHEMICDFKIKICHKVAVDSLFISPGNDVINYFLWSEANRTNV